MGIWSRLAAGLGVVASSVGVLVPFSSPAWASVVAAASVAPAVQYVGDSTGTTFRFTVDDQSSSGVNFGSVRISRPSKLWKITHCPLAPVGWTVKVSAASCTYNNPVAPSGDIQPGMQSDAFEVTATSLSGVADSAGNWMVQVGQQGAFKPSTSSQALATGSGLGAVAFVWEVLGATVDLGATPVIGSPCPTPVLAAPVGSLQTLVVCGTSHAKKVALTPSSAYSHLSGAFLQSAQSFQTGLVKAGLPDVVLGTFTGQIGPVVGPADLTAALGSGSNVLSPPTLITGYSITSSGALTLDPPNSFAATATSATSVHLSWSAAPNATGYKLTGSDGLSTTTSGTSFDDTSAPASTVLTYTVASLNAQGASQSTSSAQANTFQPSAPQVWSVSSTSIQLGLATNSDFTGGCNIYVYRATSPAGPFTYQGIASAYCTPGGGFQGYADNAVSPNTTYYYETAQLAATWSTMRSPAST